MSVHANTRPMLVRFSNRSPKKGHVCLIRPCPTAQKVLSSTNPYCFQGNTEYRIYTGYVIYSVGSCTCHTGVRNIGVRDIEGSS